MSNSLRSCTRSAILSLAVFAMVGAAQATTGDYFSSFGRVYNDWTPDIAPGGECAAASFINGAAYLKNHYPTVYGSTNIATGTVGNSQLAVQQFGSYGWTSGGTTYDGYYDRCIGDSNAHVFGDLWNTTVDWMQNSFAPGKTAFSGQAWTARSKESTSGWPYSSNLSFCPPNYDFMHAAVTANKFVELSIYTFTLNGGTGTFNAGHAVDLLNITANSITFQDPNAPGTAYTSSLSTISAFGESAMTFYDSPTFGSSPVMILTAFAMTPVPEPSTVALMAVGASGVLGYTWRKRRHRERIGWKRGITVMRDCSSTITGGNDWRTSASRLTSSTARGSAAAQGFGCSSGCFTFAAIGAGGCRAGSTFHGDVLALTCIWSTTRLTPSRWRAACMAVFRWCSYVILPDRVTTPFVVCAATLQSALMPREESSWVTFWLIVLSGMISLRNMVAAPRRKKGRVDARNAPGRGGDRVAEIRSVREDV